jgi:hypothetical protein
MIIQEKSKSYWIQKVLPIFGPEAFQSSWLQLPCGVSSNGTDYLRVLNAKWSPLAGTREGEIFVRARHFWISMVIASLYCFVRQQICNSVSQMPGFLCRYSFTQMKTECLTRRFPCVSRFGLCLAALVGIRRSLFAHNGTSVSEDCYSTKLPSSRNDRLHALPSQTFRLIPWSNLLPSRYLMRVVCDA